MSPIVNTREYEFVFGLRKQPDIFVPINNVFLNRQRSIRTFAPVTEDQPAFVSDADWFGKGDSFPTFRDVVNKMYALNSQERSATSLEALYAVAYVMGNVVSIQPNTATDPNEWQHTITWQDVSTNKEVLYTTIGEIMGAEYKKILHGTWLGQVTFNGVLNDHVTMSFQGGGRRYLAGTFGAPGITAASFYKTLCGQVQFGAADSPVDISADVLNWTVTINQNPQPLWLMGNSAGQKDLLSKILIGRQQVSGSMSVFMDATHRDKFLNQTISEIRFICESPDLIDNNPHRMEIRLHNLKISSEDITEEGDTVSLTLNFDESSVLKAGADEHCTVIFTSDIDNTELLVG